METTIYNPANKRKDQLIEEFAVRTKVFKSIFNDIKNTNVEYPGQHFLIIGPRGSGKTTLIHRVKYAIEDDSELDNYIPLTLGEEQYGISELTNLWEKISEILEDYYGFNGLYDEIEKQLTKSNYEEKCFEILTKSIESKNKTLILFIDNFGDLLKKFQDIEIKRLREILMTNKSIRLIAASPIMLNQTLDYQKPLFEFFKTVNLKGLNNSEIKTLLKKLSQLNGNSKKIADIIKNDPQRIEILRMLTGGVTRTVVLLYNIFIDNINGSSIKDLQLTLDAVTPLYKHRMDDLPKNQQKIVDAVAKSWDATSVKEIVETTRIESKVVSAQLRYLEKIQFIEKIKTDTKNHLYQVKERFFNIWYLMRYGRKFDKKRVIWLVRFLESWCSNEELVKRISTHISLLKKGDYDNDSALLLNEVYISCKAVPLELKQNLIKESKSIFPDNITKGMSFSDSELLSTAEELLREGEYHEALNHALAIKDKDVAVNYFLTIAYFAVEDFKKSLKEIKQLIRISGKETPADIFWLQGYMYNKLNKYKKAIASLKKSVKLGRDDANTELGKAYLRLKDYQNAEKYLLKGLDSEGGKSKAAHYLGHLYEKTNEVEKSIKYFETAIDYGDDRANLCLARILYHDKEDVKKAKSAYYKAVELESEEATLELASILNIEGKSKEVKSLLSRIKESDDLEIQFSLGEFYRFELKNKEASNLHFLKTKKYIKQNKELLNFNFVKSLKANSLLYLNELESSLKLFEDILADFLKEVEKTKEEEAITIPKELVDYLINLISMKYYDVVYSFFERKDMKDIFKPVYYALMHFMKKEFPNEYLKAGEEIGDVIDEILSEIEYRQL